MDLQKTLKELHEEKRRLDVAIASLEDRLNGRPRRGRPPAFLEEKKKKGPGRPKKVRQKDSTS
jgi:hypothetical protein